MTFSDEILKEFQTTLTRFKEDEDKWENHTKAEYIKKCDELVLAQIEAGIINIEVSGISSYLFKKLSDFGIKISDKTIQNNIPDEHKRNYKKSETLSELEKDVWEEIPTPDETIKIEKNQYNDIKINGKEVVEKKEKIKVFGNTTDEVRKEIFGEKETDQIKYLTAMEKLANKFALTLKSLKNRYNESKEAEDIINAELGDVKSKLEEYAKDWARLENSKGMIDLRRDFGEYEKVMANFMMNTGETIAKIASIMDYSEKYGSIGILREPRIIEFFETEDKYPLYLRSCPKCLTDISQSMNENIEYYRECQEQGIDFEPVNDVKIPTIKYNK